MVTFEQPFLLLLLIPVGILVYLTWKRMSLPFSPRQRRLILATRLTLFSLIILALAGTALSLPATNQATIFIGDISASTTTQRTFIEQWINSALQHKRPEDQVGIITVGRNALVEQSLQSQVDFSHFESTPDTSYTDLAAGMRLAAAILPANSQRHIVLLTDGQQNLGDAIQEVQILQQEGIRLDIVPLPSQGKDEARIDTIDAPGILHINEHFRAHISIYSSVAQKAVVAVYIDHNAPLLINRTLTVGEQELSFDLQAPPAGFHTLRVTLQAPRDTIIQNNEADAFLNVQGPPRVLVVEGQSGNATNIVAALKATHIDYVVGNPGDIPTTLDGLATYSTVILADVPAAVLGNTRMQMLQSFVRDLGHGLVVSGGQNSYGVGGYAGTPLEQTLPVSMDIPQHKDIPDIAVVLIIESLESNISVNISKEAAKGVISLLTPRDQVGISDAYGTLTIPMQHVANKAAIDRQIDAMDPADPGSYRPDLINAEQVLLKTTAKIKHVILLGDGDAFDNNYQSQVQKMAGENITVSTVETNAANINEMNTMINIASWGRGRFYRADDAGVIPQVLLKETEQASRRTIINEPFTPAIVGAHPIMSGLNDLPDLGGYVATTPKSAAQLILTSSRDDPVLAAWQYGLGRAVAWTSDALGLWSKDWLSWSQAARWWANMITWTLPSPDSALTVNGKIVNGTGHLSVDLPANIGIDTGLQQQAQAHIVAPDHSQESATLHLAAPQHWEADFPASQVGSYLLEVSWQETGANNKVVRRLSASSGMIVPYSPEFRSQGTNTQFLQELAHRGGGSILNSQDPAVAFKQNLVAVSRTFPITFILIALAALLLPIDIAARRLSNLDFLLIGYRWLIARLQLQKLLGVAGSQAEEKITAISAPLGNLRAVRRERQNRVLASNQGKSTSPPVTNTTTNPTTDAKTQQATVKTKPAVTEKKPAASQGSTAQKLLEAKRKREQQKT